MSDCALVYESGITSRLHFLKDPSTRCPHRRVGRLLQGGLRPRMGRGQSDGAELREEGVADEALWDLNIERVVQPLSEGP